MTNVLVNKISQIQSEYKNLLEKLSKEKTSLNILQVADCINIFWQQNKYCVELYLTNHIKKNSTFYFTASTYIDIQDKEHYPFILLGDEHIMDDPLYKFCITIGQMDKQDISDSFIEQVYLTIEDNISLLNICMNSILLLPVQLNANDEEKIILQIANNTFMSLFKNIKVINDFFELETFDDLEKELKDEAKTTILFDDEDDIKLPFKLRIENAAMRFKEQKFIIDESLDEAHIFYYLTYGHVHQLTSIIIKSISFSMIPYIRDDIAFHYLLLLAPSYIERFHNKNLCYAMYAHLLYKIVNKESLAKINFDEYAQLVKNNAFSTHLLNVLNGTFTSYDSIKFNQCIDIINIELEKLYNKETHISL